MLTVSLICRILVGAPQGRFPGGLDSDFPADYFTTDASACINVRPELIGMLSSFNESQVRKECYVRSGLIYDCSLNYTKCAAALGDGNPDSPDGFLFKRSGQCAHQHYYCCPVLSFLSFVLLLLFVL